MAERPPDGRFIRPDNATKTHSLHSKLNRSDAMGLYPFNLRAYPVGNVGYGNNVNSPLLVWIDSCCSAGGHEENPDPAPNFEFANDFGYSVDSPGVFMGWNAYSTCFGQGTCWDYWRNQFWREIGAGNNFGTAFDHTNTYTENVFGLGGYTGTASPTYRAAITGNLYGSL